MAAIAGGDGEAACALMTEQETTETLMPEPSRSDRRRTPPRVDPGDPGDQTALVPAAARASTLPGDPGTRRHSCCRATRVAVDPGDRGTRRHSCCRRTRVAIDPGDRATRRHSCRRATRVAF